MQGLHLTADLFACRAPEGLMNDAAVLQAACEQATQAAGLTVVGARFHRFGAGGGVTGVLLLAESHLAVHTWPEHHAVTLDAYVCNFSADNSAAAERLVDRLVRCFEPGEVNRQRLKRGVPPASSTHN